MPYGTSGLPPKAEDCAALIEQSLQAPDQAGLCKETEMSIGQRLDSEALPVANYSSAIAKAVEWLGDRYLLAKPINAAPSREAQAVVRMTTHRPHLSLPHIGNG
jgi:hypothetical protein